MTTTKTTVISAELKELIDTAATSFVSLAQLWNQIKEIGTAEGHTEEELQGIISSQIRKALPDKLTPDQIKKKIWYVFHNEEHKARAKANRAAQSTGGTNLRQNDAKKDIEETTNNKPTDSYYEKTIKNLEDTITELRAEITELKEPDAEYLNDMAELRALRESKTKDLNVGPFCPPNSNVYGHPKNHWKELVAAMRHLGYDIQPLYQKGLLVPPQARGFNIGITDGEFDGFFGIK